MTVTTGARGINAASWCSGTSARRDSGSSSFAALAVWPISVTTIIAVSWSSTWLIVTMLPSFISTLITSAALTDILWARSPTLMVSGTMTSRTTGSAGALNCCTVSAAGAIAVLCLARIDRGAGRTGRLSRCTRLRVALDEDALFLDLDLDGARFPARVGLLDDFGGLLARQRDLVLGFRRAVRLAQVFQEPGLVLLRKNVFGHLLVHAGRAQLLEQLRRRHFQLAGELGNARLGHGPAYSCANQCSRAFMMRLLARSGSTPATSTRSSVARSARSSRVFTPDLASFVARSLSLPARPSSAGSRFSACSSLAMACTRSASRARLRSSLTVASSKPSISIISLIGT